MRVLLFLLLSLSAFGQMDTVKVYDGLDISFLRMGDTVCVSEWKWGSVVDLLRVGKDREEYYAKSIFSYEVALSAADSVISEKDVQIGLWRQRSEMYVGLYNQAYGNVREMQDLLNEGVALSKVAIKRGRWQGAVIGVIGGIFVGAVTTAVILR